MQEINLHEEIFLKKIKLCEKIMDEGWSFNIAKRKAGLTEVEWYQSNHPEILRLRQKVKELDYP